MAIIRIEIDMTIHDGEDIADLVDVIGNLVAPVIDPHDSQDNCSRWFSVEGFELEDVTEEYEMTFTPEDEKAMEELFVHLDGLPEEFRDNSDFN